MFRNYYGPTMNAFEAAAKDGRADELQRGARGAVHRAEHAATRRTAIPATFLKVTVASEGP